MMKTGLGHGSFRIASQNVLILEKSYHDLKKKLITATNTFFKSFFITSSASFSNKL